jgi:hypothetical protein
MSDFADFQQRPAGAGRRSLIQKTIFKCGNCKNSLCTHSGESRKAELNVHNPVFSARSEPQAFAGAMDELILQLAQVSFLLLTVSRWGCQEFFPRFSGLLFILTRTA